MCVFVCCVLCVVRFVLCVVCVCVCVAVCLGGVGVGVSVDVSVYVLMIAASSQTMCLRCRSTWVASKDVPTFGYPEHISNSYWEILMCRRPENQRNKDNFVGCGMLA